MAEAKVESIDAIAEFSEAIANLRDATRKQADSIREQFGRVSNWIDNELPDYWKNELRRSEKKWIEAREELLRCEAKTRADDERPCSVQRKMLAIATERRKLCEAQVRSLPALARQWNQFLQETSATLRQLDDLSESTLQVANERLKGILETLKKYIDQG